MACGRSRRFERFGQDEEGKVDHLQQAYTHGTKCWNGPERSVQATFECGKENELLEVSEVEKCEYLYRLKSPAVCPLPQEVSPPHQQQQQQHKVVHEEL